MVHHPHTPRNHRFVRQWRLLAAALGFVLLLPTAVAAQVGDTAANGDRGVDKAHPAISDVIDFPGDTPVVVKLNCHGYVHEGVGIVGCGWRVAADTPVASWQLWNLQTRPERGSRNLVVELGADVRSYRDSNVVVPAAYVYAMLGFDADGDIVARSRLSRVALHERDRKLDVLRLDCRAHRVAQDAVADTVAELDPIVSIGCEWSATDAENAVGYQLWRSVDGGARHIIARTGLDQTSVRDHDVAVGHQYRYVVTAVDAEGHVVGRSRAATVGLRPHDRTEERVRDVEPAADTVTVRPTDHPVERPADGQLDGERDHVRRDRPTDH